MTPYVQVLTTLFTALVLGGIVYAMIVTCWRMLHDDGRLRLRRMLARRGLTLAAAPATDCEKARATRSCIACDDKARCDAWLASRRREGFAAFCPNAGLIERWSQR